MSETLVDTVRRMLRYDAISGELFWIAGKRVGKRAGYVNADGYVKVHVNGKAVPAQKIAWMLAYGFEPNGIVDHEDRVRSNNRLANLRIATASQNCANSPARNPTRMKGVSPWRRKWRAQIVVNYKVHYLGLFSTPEEANAAYMEAARAAHGEFARAA